MDNDHLNPEDLDDDYIKPQMNFCCGSRGIEISPKFKDERTRLNFVALVFSIKLVELTFIAFIVYDLAADAENQLKFNITFITAEQLKPYNWIVYVAGVLTLILYSVARCAGGGRRFCSGLILNLVKTFAIAVFCGALITFDFVYPFRYIVFLVVATVASVCVGICLLITLFEMNVLGKGIYSALFVFFLFIEILSHFIYFTTLREKYKIPFLLFLLHIGIGGGFGLILGMIMYWYMQELITGKVISLKESEYLYVCLLF